MIKTTLPTIEKRIENDELVVVEKNINVNIDTSIFAEERWEANFPANAKNETLFAYIERVKSNNTIGNKAQILTNLKALYCFLEGDEVSDFKSFCQLFDLADEDYLKKLIDKIKMVFTLALGSSAVSQKN